MVLGYVPHVRTSEQPPRTQKSEGGGSAVLACSAWLDAAPTCGFQVSSPWTPSAKCAALPAGYSAGGDPGDSHVSYLRGIRSPSQLSL